MATPWQAVIHSADPAVDKVCDSLVQAALASNAATSRFAAAAIAAVRAAAAASAAAAVGADGPPQLPALLPARLGAHHVMALSAAICWRMVVAGSPGEAPPVVALLRDMARDEDGSRALDSSSAAAALLESLVSRTNPQDLAALAPSTGLLGAAVAAAVAAGRIDSAFEFFGAKPGLKEEAVLRLPDAAAVAEEGEEADVNVSLSASAWPANAKPSRFKDLVIRANKQLVTQSSISSSGSGSSGRLAVVGVDAANLTDADAAVLAVALLRGTAGRRHVIDVGGCDMSQQGRLQGSPGKCYRVLLVPLFQPLL